MPDLYEITFLPSGRIEPLLGFSGIYYKLNDGSLLNMETTPVWCHRCGKIGMGEKIETPDEIDKVVTDLQDPMSLHYRFTSESLRPCWIEAIKRRRVWRQQRQSAPKCVVCGSTKILIFAVDQQVPHPAGEGFIEISNVGLYDLNPLVQVFTPEGDRIPSDEPAYLFQPEMDG